MVKKGFSKIPYPAIRARDMLIIQGRSLTYMYKNLEDTMVFTENGSDMIIS